MPQPHFYKFVTVIGAGPSGLMAAEQCAAAGFKVTVYDAMPSVGRKFLMAGRGGLNLTHSEALSDFIPRYGTAADWMSPAMIAFPPDALRQWCETLGQPTFIGSSGRVFPVGLKTSPLLRAWIARLNALGVKFELRYRWHGWDPTGNLLFSNTQTHDVNVKADAVILALGGASWPRLGSDGNWVDILRKQGIDIASLRPSNCGFIALWSDYFAERFAGHPLKPVTLSFAGKTIQGEVMVTKQGVEGGAIYALSGALRDAIEKQGEAALSLDIRPGLSREELTVRLSSPRGSQSASNFLRKAAGLTPLSIALMRESTRNQPLPTDAAALSSLIKNIKIKLTAITDINRAISSAGGIPRLEVTQNFMLRKKPGTFIAGEMLDWEAPTGGYLLQGCFSTAVAAAEGVKAYLAAGAAGGA